MLGIRSFLAAFVCAGALASPCDGDLSVCSKEESDETGLLAVSRVQGRHGKGEPLQSTAFLDSLAEEREIPKSVYTVSGTLWAQGYKAANAAKICLNCNYLDCETITASKAVVSAFAADVFHSSLKAFLSKCEQVTAGVNKYWFTISSESEEDLRKVCDPDLVLPQFYSPPFNTYVQQMPLACGPIAAPSVGNDFLAAIAKDIQLPTVYHTVSGTVFATYYKTEKASKINRKAMRQDCEIINHMGRLHSRFLAILPGMFTSDLTAFFYKCQRAGRRNRHWFTISSSSQSDLDKLCNKNTSYPLLDISKYGVYYQFYPFSCEDRDAKQGRLY